MVNWNEVWKSEMTDHHANGILYFEGAGTWDTKENAHKYWDTFQSAHNPLTNWTVNEMNLEPDDRVLDIGAGPGVVSLPVARKVSSVMAVEPSKHMVEIMKRQAELQSIQNIHWIQKKWDDVDVKVDLADFYDVVFASFSLFVVDLEKAIKKMEQVASRYIYLFWFIGEGTWEALCASVWPLLYGKRFPTRPKTDILLNVLFQMGIYPNVKFTTFTVFKTFACLEEALNYYRPKFKIISSEQEEKLRVFLRSTFEKEDGSYSINQNPYYAKIWWNMEHRHPRSR